MAQLGLSTEDGYSTISEQTLWKEIDAWRTRLRTANYLKPTDGNQHTSLGGTPLDQQLVNFGSQCKENQQMYRYI
jgi:hypothetical protein